MSDSSDFKASYKLFTYKSIEGAGLITVITVINNNVYCIKINGESKYFQFSEMDTKPNPDAVKKLKELDK